jgi:flagellum-specific peptidoglycan hydrolase FlgJ
MKQQDFFNKYANFAKSAIGGSGLSETLILSQAFLESGAGDSVLAKKYNNFFGVKADASWTGKKVLLSTSEQDKNGKATTIKQYFRVYENPGQSFAGQIAFLKSNPRYKNAGLFTYPNDYAKQADTLQKAGYATDIKYSDKLKNIAHSFSSMVLKVNPVPVLIAIGFFLH